MLSCDAVRLAVADALCVAEALRDDVSDNEAVCDCEGVRKLDAEALWLRVGDRVKV